MQMHKLPVYGFFMAALWVLFMAAKRLQLDRIAVLVIACDRPEATRDHLGQLLR